jgi:spermidine synthase
VRIGGTEQSFVDVSDPTYLEFEYVQRIAEVIDHAAEPGAPIRVVHVGGGGLTLPRYVAATRPTSAQIVLEPDIALIEEVRAHAPLAKMSGVKVRPTDGRSGLAEMPADYADLIIMDAFDGACVPAELVTREWFALVAHVLRADGTLVANLTDKAPFAWSRRVVAGIRELCPTTIFAAEPAVIKGRRFGNLVVSSGPTLNVAALERVASRATFPYRVISGPALTNWLGNAHPFADSDTQPSPPPEDFGVTTLTRHKE